MSRTTTASRLRYRRAPHLVAYWRGDQLILEHYAGRVQIEAGPLVLDVLNRFSTWEPVERIARQLPQVPRDLLQTLIDALVDYGALEIESKPTAAGPWDTWTGWSPAASFFHQTTKDVPFTARDETNNRLKARATQDPIPPALKPPYRGKRIVLPPPRSAPQEDGLPRRPDVRRDGRSSENPEILSAPRSGGGPGRWGQASEMAPGGAHPAAAEAPRKSQRVPSLPEQPPALASESARSRAVASELARPPQRATGPDQPPRRATSRLEQPPAFAGESAHSRAVASESARLPQRATGPDQPPRRATSRLEQPPAFAGKSAYSRAVASESARPPQRVASLPDQPPKVGPAHTSGALGISGFPDVLLSRRTWRRFGRRRLHLDELATLLGLTWGVQGWMDIAGWGRMALKTSPSGGARHSIEAYVLVRNVEDVAPGVYHYQPASHELHMLRRLTDTSSRAAIAGYLPQQGFYAEASALMLMSAVFARVQWRYAFPRAYRTVLAEAGHHAQTFCLAATWLGLAPFCTMALADTRIERDLNIDGVSESVLYATGVGPRPAGVTWAPWANTAATPVRTTNTLGRSKKRRS